MEVRTISAATYAPDFLGKVGLNLALGLVTSCLVIRLYFGGPVG